MAYQYANIKNHLHGIAVKGRFAYAMRAGSVGTLCNWPAYLKQAGGRAELRIERLVKAVLHLRE
jgi:hypothetical protein